MLAGKNYSTTGTAVGPTPAALHAIVATLSSVHCRPVECPPDYVFVEYDRLRARRHGAQDRRTRYPSRASSRLHAQLTKLFERCLFYYTGQSHCDIFPGKLTAPSPETSHIPTLAVDLPVECPPDYVFVEYDRLRARRHGAQDRRTRYPSRASSRLHAQLTKLFERCLFYYTGQSHCDIFPGKLTAPSPETSHIPTLAVDLPVECPPDYVFVEYDRPRARRHGALFCD